MCECECVKPGNEAGWQGRHGRTGGEREGGPGCGAGRGGFRPDGLSSFWKWRQGHVLRAMAVGGGEKQALREREGCAVPAGGPWLCRQSPQSRARPGVGHASRWPGWGWGEDGPSGHQGGLSGGGAPFGWLGRGRTDRGEECSVAGGRGGHGVSLSGSGTCAEQCLRLVSLDGREQRKQESGGVAASAGRMSGVTEEELFALKVSPRSRRLWPLLAPEPGPPRTTVKGLPAFGVLSRDPASKEASLNDTQIR